MAPAQGWHAKSWSVPHFCPFFRYQSQPLRSCSLTIPSSIENDLTLLSSGWPSGPRRQTQASHACHRPNDDLKYSGLRKKAWVQIPLLTNPFFKCIEASFSHSFLTTKSLWKLHKFFLHSGTRNSKSIFKRWDVWLCWSDWSRVATHGRDPTADRHGSFELLGFPPWLVPLLLRQPGPRRLLLQAHVDADLSADTCST